MSAVVVASAARNALGNAPAPVAAAVRAGVSRVQDHERLVDPLGEPLRAASCSSIDGDLDEGLSATQRMATLAQSTLMRLRAQVGPGCAGEPPVLLAVPSPRPGFDAAARDALVAGVQRAARSDAGGPPLGPVRTIPHDHTGGLEALAQAVSVAAAHPSGLCVVGGVESSLDGTTLAGRIAHHGVSVDGRGRMVPGEGAAFMLIATAAARHAFRTAPEAVVLGSGLTAEGPRSPDDELLGVALSQAVRTALSQAPAGPPVPRVLSDINAERWRSEDWGFAILRCGQLFVEPTGVEMPSGQWGDLGAATGVSLAVLACQGWARGHAPGERCLLLCSSAAGRRAAVLLGRA